MLKCICIWIFILIAAGCGVKENVQMIPISTQTTPPTATVQIEEKPTGTIINKPSPVPTETEIAPPQSSLEKNFEQITLITSDSAELNGFLYLPDESNNKGVGVVLAHESNSNHTTWNNFAELISERGFTVLTFDFRGYTSSKGGNPLYSKIGIDAATAANYLKDMGIEKVICIGASMGGTSCLVAAINLELEGLVMISSAMNPPDGGRLVRSSELKVLTTPKLFVIAENDLVNFVFPDFVENFIELSEKVPEPKELVIYPGYSHGTELFYAPVGEDFQNKLVSFLESYLQ